MADSFDPYYRWLGIRPEEQPPSHYRLLGIQEFEDNPDVIEAAADRQMAHLHTYQSGRHAEQSQKLLNEVASARVCLLNPEKKAGYDRNLRKHLAVKASMPPMPPQAKPAQAKLVNAEPVAEEQAWTQSLVPAESGKYLSSATIRRAVGKRSSTPFIISGAAAAAVVVVLIAVLGPFSDKKTENDDRIVLRDGQSATLGFENRPTDNSTTTPPTERPPAAEPPAEETPPTRFSPARHVLNSGHRPRTLADLLDNEDVPEETVTDARHLPPAEAEQPGTEEGNPPTHQPQPQPAEPPVVEKKHPVPSEEARAEVVNQLEEVYDFSKANTSNEKLKLSRELFEQAGKSSGNPAERFVLLHKSMELAGEAGNAIWMLSVVDEIGRRFEIDVLNIQGKTLSKFADQTKKKDADRVASFVEASRSYIDRALSQERYDLALNIATLAYRICLKSGSRTLRKEMLDRRHEIQALHDEHKKFQEALAAVKKNPNDAEAHTLLGRLYCFARNDWRQGLPHLAKCNDADLATMAKREVDSPPGEPNAQIDLADAWWDLAQTRKDKEKEALMLHAGYWYRQAQPNVSGGLTKVKLDKRLAEIAKIEQGRDQQVTSAPKTHEPRGRARKRLVPGLIAEYYKDENFKQLAAIHIDPVVGLERILAGDPRIPLRNISIRWNGWLVVPVAGSYTFKMRSSGKRQLWIDGKLMLDKYQYQSPYIYLTKQQHPICIEFSQNSDTYYLHFSSLLLHTPGEHDVPAAALFHSKALLDKIRQKVENHK